MKIENWKFKFKLKIVLTKLMIKHAASEMFGILKNLTNDN